MNKKIVVLNGSPRPNGNTRKIIDNFVRGAEESGNEVVVFDLNKMNIHGCLGCCHGGKDHNSPCVQKDDMLKIYPKYKEADIVVLASPLYYWTISGQLKTAFDRLFAVAECDANYNNPQKDAILLMAAEGYEFEESKYWYERLLKHLKWNNLGEVLIGGVMSVGDIDKKQEELKKAYDLGKSI